MRVNVFASSLWIDADWKKLHCSWRRSRFYGLNNERGLWHVPPYIASEGTWMLQRCSELANAVKFWYRHVVVFVDRSLHLLSVRLQILEHCTFNFHLPVSAVFGYQQIDFTITCLKRNTDLEAFLSQWVYWNTLKF